jgi:tRNA (mo5U34)-methyltransferase
MHDYDIRELRDRAVIFEKRLEQIKADLAPQDYSWYPYRTLTVYAILDELLTGPRRRLLDLVGGDPILDIGCADGANSFFFETLGCQVLAVDNQQTNHSWLRGFNALKAALQSSVAFRQVDLDTQCSLPDDIFGLALFLGVLYHLKNPFYVLEALAARVRYCLLSTRIARQTPLGNPMQNEALVYLLDSDECNHDNTNQWIFSETALRRLLDKTGWTVLDFMTAGDTRTSEPGRLDRDERAFCLLESRVCRRYAVNLLEGWHELEQSSFRWTKKHFAIELHHPPSAGFSTLRLAFHTATPEPVTLAATVNGIAVAPSTYAAEGEHSYAIPLSGRPSEPVRVDFTADQNVHVASDGRELAILVPFWKPGLDKSDPLLPFQLS